jgi:thioredoxin 2
MIFLGKGTAPYHARPGGLKAWAGGIGNRVETAMNRELPETELDNFRAGSLFRAERHHIRKHECLRKECAMSNPLHIVCPHCATTNRVPAERAGAGPRCGQCHQALFDGHPVELDEAGFERHVAGDLPVVVDFWAPWCGPCRSMAPEFEKAAGMLEPSFRMAKVNTEVAQNLAQRFDIRSIPTMALFRGGREIARQSGAMGAAAIASWVRANA